MREIAIRPTSAVLRYAKQTQDPVAAGRELGVDSVLEGSVQRTHEQIRVTVRLVSVRDGSSFWAEQFDAPFTDILRVQDSIAERVTRALKIKLTGDITRRSSSIQISLRPNSSSRALTSRKDRTLRQLRF